MDFTKFVSVLDTQRLFFNRIDNFEDRFEGSIPKKNAEELERFFQAEGQPNVFSKLLKEQLEHYAVSCWHINADESTAMWRLYLSGSEGIAISSTLKRLKTCLLCDDKVYIGKVKYIDYQSDKFSIQNSLNPLIHKQKSFEHEKEIRAVVNRGLPSILVPDEDESIQISREKIKGGVSVQVDLSVLVQQVKVSPGAPEWFLELVKSLVAKYSYKFKVSRSNLDGEPIY